MRFKPVALALSLSLICLAPKVSFADTLTLESATGNSSGPSIYPYGFSFDGSSSFISLSCLSFNREVSIGETWNVTVTNLAAVSTSATIDGSTDTALREDAFLDYYYGSPSITGIGAVTNSEIQYAIWDILDPTDVHSLALFDSTSQKLVSAASAAAAAESNAFLSQFTLYTPAGGTGLSSEPQQFLGFTAGTGSGLPPAVTPEPESLALLGTGLLGMVGVMRRRVLDPLKA